MKNELKEKLLYPLYLFAEKYSGSAEDAIFEMVAGHFSTKDQFKKATRLEVEGIIRPFVDALEHTGSENRGKWFAKSGVVVDYAAGPGRLEPYLSRLAGRVYAVEPNFNYRALGKKYTSGMNNVFWKGAGIFTCDLPSNAANLTIGFHFIHHVGRFLALRILKELFRITRCDGLVLTNVRYGTPQEWKFGQYRLEEVIRNARLESVRIRRYEIQHITEQAKAVNIIFAMTRSRTLTFPSELISEINAIRLKDEA